jgi:single-stranded-DNA-specific exonuclease
LSTDPSGHDRPFLGVARSVTGKAWRARLDDAGEAAAAAIAQRHETPEILARVLAGRGVTTETVEAYLSPTIRAEMPDPSELTDLDAAAARLADAVAAGEAVAIFGDYDVDGATSAALLHDLLAACGLEPRIYIPDRIFEGYGPNRDAINQLIDEGSTLIVTVDCGVTSFEALEQARTRGVDVVVRRRRDVSRRRRACPAVAATQFFCCDRAGTRPSRPARPCRSWYGLRYRPASRIEPCLCPEGSGGDASHIAAGDIGANFGSRPEGTGR